MPLHRIVGLALLAGAVVSSLPAQTPQKHISSFEPVQDGRALSAERLPTEPVTVAAPRENPPAHNWQLQATLPGSVIHDIGFASPSIGYAVGEGGIVYKTTNGWLDLEPGSEPELSILLLWRFGS